MGAIDHLAAEPRSLIEVDPGVEQRHNEDIQASLARSVWADGCDNWYKDDAGRIVNNWPGLTLEYARATRRFDAENYRVTKAVQAVESPSA
jgi:hypothetical protein